MGIIQKQTIANAIYSYAGILVGFLTTGLLFPHILSTDENGLIKLLISFSVLAGQFANLGMGGVILRVFPQFRHPDSRHHGFIFYPLLATLLGFVLCVVAYYLFKDALKLNFSDKSALLSNYLYLLLPLTFFTAIFTVIDLYARSLFNTVIGVIHKEFIQRLLILALILLYFFDFISFHLFIWLFIVSHAWPPIVIWLRLLKDKDWAWKPDLSFLSPELKREMCSVALYYFVSGFSFIAVSSIDSIMVNQYLGLDAAGIYAIVFYFATLIVIPSRALLRISYPILAEAWKRNDIEEIGHIYRKSCINQLLIGVLLFILLWANIENVLKMLPNAYASGKYVILFVGLGNLFDMATGVNGAIINTSRYYRFDAWFLLGLVGLTIISNMIFIPLYGLTGAAIATACSMIIYNIIRLVFLLLVIRLFPFSRATFIIPLVGMASYISVYWLPEMPHFLVDLFVRSAIVFWVFLFLLILLKPSEDIHQLLLKIRHILLNRMK